ncbi:MAG: ribonuclease HII [Nocardioides sp.]
MSLTATPTLRLERSLLRQGRIAVAGVDEVGRGALCGPVTIGVVVVTATTRTAPQGVRDSKLLTPAARDRMAPRIKRWATAWGVGHASAQEIDEHGLMAAMRMAGRRALTGLAVPPDLIILDGNHDYLTASAQPALFGEFAAGSLPPVVTRIKADLTCASVAAASVLAKTARDEIVVGLAGDHPEYGWRENKGYAAAEHLDALRLYGATPHHRRSWKLPTSTTAASTARNDVLPVESEDHHTVSLGGS